MLDRKLDGGILTLRLAHGKASAMDLELCEALRMELETVAEGHEARALILTGTGSIFSAGVDLPRLINSTGDYVPRFVAALDSCFRAMFLFPRPLIAAVNGHAIAGGAIMAWAADYRLMSGGKIGVPEALVGVPFPPLALEIVRYGVPHQYLQAIVHLAQTYDANTALKMGLVDEVLSADELLPRARQVAEQLADIPHTTFALTKRQLREQYLHNAAHMAASTADAVDAAWSAPETHERIRSYLARTIGKAQRP